MKSNQPNRWMTVEWKLALITSIVTIGSGVLTFAIAAWRGMTWPLIAISVACAIAVAVVVMDYGIRWWRLLRGWRRTNLVVTFDELKPIRPSGDGVWDARLFVENRSGSELSDVVVRVTGIDVVHAYFDEELTRKLAGDFVTTPLSCRHAQTDDNGRVKLPIHGKLELVFVRLMCDVNGIDSYAFCDRAGTPLFALPACVAVIEVTATADNSFPAVDRFLVRGTRQLGLTVKQLENTPAMQSLVRELTIPSN
jgi:hypothetical protein